MTPYRLLIGAGLLVAAATAAADAPFAYQQPPEAMRRVLDAPTLPARLIDPTGTTLAIVESRRYPRIEELARPFLRLAGLRVDPGSNGPHRTTEIRRIVLRPLLASADPGREVVLPAAGGFHGLRFSPDGKRFVLLQRTADATHLWLGGVDEAAIRRVPGLALQALGEDEPFEWIGSDRVVVRARPEGLTLPAMTGGPAGPTVVESFGRKSPEPTYQDLLRSPRDEALFAHHFTSQLVRLDLATGERRVIGPAAPWLDVRGLGDGRHLLVQRLVPPWSYSVTYEDFAREVEVIDLDGKPVRKLARVALRENVPVQGVIQGPRDYVAAPLGGIFWTEALDGGDPKQKVPARDRLLMLAAPYTGEPVEVLRTPQRLVSLGWLEDGRVLVTDYDRDRVWRRTVVADPRKPGSETPVLFDLSARDRYHAPGTPVQRVLASGRSVIGVREDAVLFTGNGATPAGDRPFLDRWTLATRSKVRLFQSGDARYEPVVRVLDDRGERFVTAREGPGEPPNLVLHEAARERALTSMPDPMPQLRDIKRELVRFKRRDGVDLSFWLYRPAGMKPGERRPALLWAYPLEYTDASLAGQVSGAVNRYTQYLGASPLFMALEGYVVLMDATMPVVGDPEKVNDTFVEQITMNAEAAIDKAAELGIVDSERVAVGGHSYGAFMTANLLAHTDLFKAGIARSGAYNRTLTPFGFQSERRTFWEAPEAYFKLSPFMHANQLKEPILLIHGEADNNSGTFPEQSERMFAALAGNGGRVRFVKLPAEAHGYAARESVGHTLWEMSTWLHRFLGDPK